MARITKNIGLALLIVLVVSACGRRGDLVKPAAVDDGQSQPADKKPGSGSSQSKDSFILDPLIR